jgi:hypothetical protein
MVRNIIGLISGIAVGGLIVGLIRTLALNRYPIAENLSSEDLSHALGNMPNGFYFFIIGSHIFGAFAAGMVTAIIAKKHKSSWGLVAAMVILAITAYSNYTNLNPDWVKLLDLSSTAIAGYLGAKIPSWRSA